MTGASQNSHANLSLLSISNSRSVRLLFCRGPNEVASSRPDHLPTLLVAKSSKLSLLAKHNIMAIDEAS